MVSFVSNPFSGNGSITFNTHSHSWCAISSNKVALVYEATIGGVRKLMVQIVNFNAGAAPQYGPACSVGNSNSGATYLHQRIISINSNQLILQAPANSGSTQYKLMLLEFDEQDRVWLVNTCPDNIIQPNRNGVPQISKIADNVAVVSHRQTTALNRVQRINVSGGSIQLTPLPVDYVMDTSSYMSDMYMRRGLDGKDWHIWVSGDENVFCTSFDRQASQANNFDFNVQPSIANGNFERTATGNRVMLPVRDGKVLSLICSPVTDFMLFDNGAKIAQKTYKLSTPSGSVMDATWLDDTHFMMILTSINNAEFGNSVGQASFANLPASGANGIPYVFIGAYDEIGQTITPADTFPVAVGTATAGGIPARSWDRIIHKIDQNNVALIGPKYNGGTWGYGIQMLSV